MTKWQLFSLLTAVGAVWFTHNTEQYRLISIEREDGSGNKFNLKVYDSNGHRREFFIKTVD